MHHELVAISNVWQRDASTDALKGEHEALSAAVAAATRTVEAGRTAVAAAQAELDRVKKEERASNRALEEYVARRTSTQKLIDTGAGDYAAAMRQLENVAHIIDELEDKGLVLLDALDAAERALATGQKDLAKAEGLLAETKAALTARDAPIRTELAAVLKAREAAWAELPVEYRIPYTELRRRKRKALVNTVEGNCTQCHMRIPPQRLVEVQLDRAVHTCPGCQGYILP